MNKEEFVKCVTGQLVEIYGDRLSIQMIMKQNDIEKTGVSIIDVDGSICEMIYVDDLFKKYKSGDMDMGSIIKTIEERFNHHEIPKEIIHMCDNLCDWDIIKEKVRPRLVFASRNKKLLADLIHKSFLDFEVIYIIAFENINNGNDNASIKINKELFSKLGISEEELHEQAVENMRLDHYYIKDIRGAITDVLGEEVCNEMQIEQEPDMLILTCKEGRYGSAGILDKEFMNRATKGRKYCMLPSSIYEWILIPFSDELCVESLTEMIQEINKLYVEPEDVLSDHPYIYDGQLSIG